MLNLLLFLDIANPNKPVVILRFAHPAEILLTGSKANIIKSANSYYLISRLPKNAGKVCESRMAGETKSEVSSCNIEEDHFFTSRFIIKFTENSLLIIWSGPF